MKANRLPNWKLRRDYLYSENSQLDNQRAADLARKALELELYQDAVRYGKLSQDENLGKELVEIFIKMGDFFLLKQLHESWYKTDEDGFLQLAKNAEAEGKESMAFSAYLYLDKDEDQQRVQKALAAHYDDLFTGKTEDTD